MSELTQLPVCACNYTGKRVVHPRALCVHVFLFFHFVYACVCLYVRVGERNTDTSDRHTHIHTDRGMRDQSLRGCTQENILTKMTDVRTYTCLSVCELAHEMCSGSCKCVLEKVKTIWN